jgi:hypothetical protein
MIGNITSVGTGFRPNFEVDQGVSWTLVWTLMTTKGKGRILDVAEVTSGYCE